MTNLTNGTMTIKVGALPGKLSEVVVNNGTSAREIFEIAGVEVSNHEVRLDGAKIDMDDSVTNGNLLVAMKMIKGNVSMIKVGALPGKLTEIVMEQDLTAREVFELAGVEVSNHEVRLDGVKIDIDDSAKGGKLLVAMKMIKGNREVYMSQLSESEIQNILDIELPSTIETDDVKDVWANTLEVLGNIVDEDMFLSVYELAEVKDETKEEIVTGGLRRVVEEVDIKEIHVEESHVCICKSAIDVIKEEINNEIESRELWLKYASECSNKIDMLEELLTKIQG